MRSIVLKLALLTTVLVAASFALRVVPGFPIVWGNPLVQAKVDHLLENDYDTVFLGSSRVYRQLQPQVFDEVVGRGTNTFNLGGPGFRFPQTYQLCRYLLDSPRADDLRYIVMELDVELGWPSRRNLHTKRVVYWYDLPTFLRAAEIVSAAPASRRTKLGIHRRQFVTWVDYVFNVGLGEDTVEFLFDRDAHWAKVEQAGIDIAEGRGFRSLDEDLAADTDGLVGTRHAQLLADPEILTTRTERSRAARQKGLASSAPNPALLATYRDLLERAEQRGIEMYFLVPPRRARDYETLLPVLHALPEDRRLDLSATDRFAALYEMKYSFDVGHLNTAGSRLFTQLVAEEFLERTRAATQDESRPERASR